MAMKQVMTKEAALKTAGQLALAFGKFGAQISVPYTQSQLLEVISVLHANGNWDAPTREELTKVKRQLTAALAREAKCKGKQETIVAGKDCADWPAQETRSDAGTCICGEPVGRNCLCR